MKKINKKRAAILSGLLIICLLSIGATLAVLMDKTEPVMNIFNPVAVNIDIEEEFDGTEKTGVAVANKDKDATDVYVRVKLVHSWYRNVNGVEQQAGKADWTVTGANNAEINSGDGYEWFYCAEDGYYYYRNIVEAKTSTIPLIETITLLQAADGTYQGLEIIAEAIQANGKADNVPVVTQAWGVTVNTDKTISK